MGVLIHNGINYTGGGGGIPTMKITRAQYEAQKAYYDALDALIVITDDNMVITATGITFNNSGTGMSATNVQGAITELNSNLADVRRYSQEITVPANGTVYITANNFTPAITPVGNKTPILSGFDTGSSNLIATYVKPKTGTDIVFVIKNVSASPITETCNIDIAWVGTAS